MISNLSDNDYVIILSNQINYKTLLKVIKNKKNSFLIIISKHNSIIYNPQIIDLL